MVKVVNVAEIETVSKVVDKKDKKLKSKGKKTKSEKSKKIIKSFWKAFFDRCSAYCAITSIHGWGHMVRLDFAKWERWIWAFFCFTSIVVASTLLWMSLSISAETPTMTIIESTHHPTWAIPYPAVTICNLNKIDSVNMEKEVNNL